MAELEFKTNVPGVEAQEESRAENTFTRDELFALYKQQLEMIEQLRATIANLSETVAYLTRKIYGTSREKLPITGQLDIFGNIYGETSEPEIPAPKPDEDLLPPPEETKPRAKRSNRSDLFDGVETKEEVIPVPDEERTCNICGRTMEPVGKEKVREVIEITPMQVKRIIIFREVLACPDCKDEYGDFAYKKADAPAPLISHSMATPSAVSYLMNEKFVNSMTFYRLEKALESMGAPIGRETMADWFIECGLNILKPLADLLFTEQKLRDLLHGDETWCQVLKEPGKTAQSKSYIWLLATGDDGLPPIVTYHYFPSREHTVAEELLGDFNGYLHTDKYGGYNCLEDHIIRCLCWAHGRRKWFEAISPDIRDRDRSGLTIDDLTTAEIGFLYCNKLFEKERKFKDLPPKERKQLRIKEEKPILASFWTWLEGLDPLGGSKLEKAVNYFKDSREEFENYLKDGRCSLSNNWAENYARPYVIGRKNFLFHNSVDGANASAVIYSIVLTAKANNLDIRKYLEVLLQRMPDYKNEPEGIRNLLPWSPEIQAECQRPASAKGSK